MPFTGTTSGRSRKSTKEAGSSMGTGFGMKRPALLIRERKEPGRIGAFSDVVFRCKNIFGKFNEVLIYLTLEKSNRNQPTEAMNEPRLHQRRLRRGLRTSFSPL